MIFSVFFVVSRLFSQKKMKKSKKNRFFFKNLLDLTFFYVAHCKMRCIL